jgi:3-mercaptopyruvate sulfurtransferase SseA
MPDPWLSDEELKEHEEAVAGHELSDQAKDVREQDEENSKALAEARAEEEFNDEPSAVEEAGFEVGPAADAEVSVPPAGNVDSPLPTQAEKEEAAEEDQKEEEKKSGGRRSSKKDSTEDKQDKTDDALKDERSK